MGSVLAAGLVALGNASAVRAACAASARGGSGAPTTKVYGFGGVRFEEPPKIAVHQDISGRTCAPRGIGVWRVTFVTTNDINPSNTGTTVIDVTVKRLGVEAFDSTGRFSLTTLPGPKIRVWLHAYVEHSATVPVTVKQGTCKCPELAKGQKLSMRPSRQIADYIRKTEKFRSKPYDDLGPGKGACTVGYGHVLHNSPCTGKENSVTKSEAEALFQQDLASAGAEVAASVRVQLNQNQFDAMLDFAYNAGLKGRKKLLGDLNACNYDALFAQMRKVVTSKGKRYQALVDRREYEIALFKK